MQAGRRARSGGCLLRLREGVDGARALRTEDERELPLGLETAIGWPVGRARLPEIQSAEHVLAEVAIRAGRRLRLSHSYLPPPEVESSPAATHHALSRRLVPEAIPQIGDFCFHRWARRVNDPRS